MSRTLKIILSSAAALVFLGVGLLIVNSFTHNALNLERIYKKPTATPTPTASPTPTPNPTPTPEPPPDITPTLVTMDLPPVDMGIPCQHEGLAITVYGATLMETVSGFTPMAGMTYMLADVEIQNLDLQQYEYLFLFLGFVDENGNAYYPPHPSPDIVPAPPVNYGVLLKGESIRGNILLEIPADATSGLLKYNTGTDHVQIWCQFFWEE